MRATYPDNFTDYFVENENTLVYRINGDCNYGILAGKPQLGGRNWRDGTFHVSTAGTVRPATQKDFDFYRVVPPKPSERCKVEW